MTSSEDEAQLQTLIRQLLTSISDNMCAAPSAECAEEILLHLEETDRNFHNYEFVKHIRQYVDNSLGTMVDGETKSFILENGQHDVCSGHDTLIHAVVQTIRESAEYQQMSQALKNSMIVAVESLINKFEEDHMRKEMYREKKPSQSNSQYDNCSDSDSSFNQSYAFIKQEQLQALAENLDSSRPKEVRLEALQILCSAPPSDVLSCESWTTLRRNLCAVLSESEPDLSDNILQFFAKSFSFSPLNLTREIYTSLANSVQTSFLSLKLSFPTGSANMDISRPEISLLLKQIRLMNDFQKEVTSFWIRYPEKYMEEIIESTFSLLSLYHETYITSAGGEKSLEPIHLLVLLDIKATWFKKWTHGHYSRTVVLRHLEKSYKSLIAAAVQQCIIYTESSGRSTKEITDTSESTEQQNICSAQTSAYTGAELEYAFFVHSLCVLGNLLMYTNGRKLFPIDVWIRKDPVSLTDLVVILINIMYQQPNHPRCDSSHKDFLSPSTVVMEILRNLCERTACAAECIYQSPVIQTLLDPAAALLKGQQSKLKSPAATLTLIADVLARIASTDGGLSLFLNDKNLAVSHTERTFAADVIVQFTLKLLDKELPSLSESDTYCTLCGAYIFVCRHIYSTCEGLQVLRPYGLHKAIAAAWKKTSLLSERVPTPEPGAHAGASIHEQQNMLIWEETLLDSLLNFAATPKGLLLLQQTGAINECVSYMFSHLNKKQQVSRSEKFGYGMILAQIGTTAPGVAALRSSGFVRTLAIDLWTALECGSNDVRVVYPKPTPMDPIDRSCLKFFLSLTNLLSTPQSVWELLGQQPLANKTEYTLREMPTSIPDLIDRLIAVNSDAKIYPLFHYEESHTFGLRLLSVLCCSLDSFLLLESQYNICSMLLQSQSENVTSDGEFIIDSLSVERNHVLVRVSAVGGPSERRLPPRDLQEGDSPYPWPMFSCYPVPRWYTLDPPKMHHNPQDCEIIAFLTSTEDTANEERWMDICRRHYCTVMATEPSILPEKVLADLLEKVIAHLSNSTTECFFSPAQYKAEEDGVKSVVLSSVEQLGIDVCIRYGNHLQLLKDDAVHGLTLLTKHMKLFLSRQRAKPSSDIFTQQDSYPGHDWLISTVFLIMAGDMDRSLHLLLNLSSLITSAFIWPARIYASVHVAETGIPPIYWCTAHYVEMLLKVEVPLVHSAFRMSGFTPSQICLQWLGQCFWNYLDWPEICRYISTCVVMGPDYQVYICVAIFKHLKPDILQRTQAQELQVFLKEEPIQGFKTSDYLEMMEGLERKYRNIILADMKSIKTPGQQENSEPVHFLQDTTEMS